MTEQAFRAQAVAHVPAAHKPAYQAYNVLHWGFVVLPVVAGLDKFTMILTDWTRYLAAPFARIMDPAVSMRIVGAIEIVAGLLVALRPRIGATVVAFWLWAIVVDLLVAGTYYDVALRDFGLSLGALALAKLAREFEPVHAS